MKRISSSILAVAITILLFNQSVTAETNVTYYRIDDFESYNLGMIAGEGANSKGVQSKDGAFWFKDAVTAGKKAGWSPGASNGYELNLVTTKDKHGNDTRAVQILRPKEKATDSKAGGLLQLNPDTQTFNEDYYVYKAMLRNGDESASHFNQMYFSYLKIMEKSFAFTTGSNTQTYNLPPAGTWYEFKFIINQKTGDVYVCIDENLICKNNISDYKSGAKGSNPRWGPMYNYTNIDNAFYIDDVEIYTINGATVNSLPEDGAVSAEISNKIQINILGGMPIDESTLSQITVTNSNGAVNISDYSFENGSLTINLQDDMDEFSRYIVDLSNVKNILGESLPKSEITFTTTGCGYLTLASPKFYKIALGEENNTVEMQKLESALVDCRLDITNEMPMGLNAALIAVLKKGKYVENISYMQKLIAKDENIVLHTGFDVPDGDDYSIEIFVWDNLIGKNSYSEKFIFDQTGLTSISEK